MSNENEIYRERNQVVALLSKIFPAGVRKTDIPGWDPKWHGCVYINLPTGQVSWHYHDDDAPLFAHLPEYKKPWDGHTTEEKYERVKAYKAGFGYYECNLFDDYKGFSGSAHVSVIDQCLFGRIVDIDDIIIYEGQTINELKCAFKEAVDEYIEHKRTK